MLLTLHASCVRSLLKPEGKGKPAVALADLPTYAREVLGLRGLALTTDLLAGADRKVLENLKERADKAGCANLVLFEPAVQNVTAEREDQAAPALDRIGRVVQAAQLLGCSSAAFMIPKLDQQPARELAAARLRKLVQRSEKLDVNILISPESGSAIVEPDHITDLLKRVGGFRIGTFPDFLTASKAKDPIAYLRRLSPYALAISAVALELGPPEAAPAPAASPTRKASGGGAAALLEAIASAGKKKGGPVKPADDEPEDAVDDEPIEEELEDEELLEGLDDDDDAPPPAEPLPSHKAYDLRAFVQAVASVGYDGAVCVDYRGGGDVAKGVNDCRRILQAALDALAGG